MWWVGNKNSIEDAANQAAVLVTSIPETKDGYPLPKEQWVTRKWADPIQLIDRRYAIPVYIGLQSNLETIENISDLIEEHNEEEPQ